MQARESYFDGGILSYFLMYLLVIVLTIVTLGFGAPWAIVLIHRWHIEHTVIEGKRLVFRGTGSGLLGNWIKWWLLTIITFGIYGFWVHIKLEQWKAKHTYFEEIF